MREKLPTVSYEAKTKKVIDELAEDGNVEDKAGDDKQEEQLHCGICLVEFEDAEQLKALNCVMDTDSGDKANVKVQHLFHEDCIRTWFEKK